MLARLVFSLVLGLLMYIPRPVPRPPIDTVPPTPDEPPPGDGGDVPPIGIPDVDPPGTPIPMPDIELPHWPPGRGRGPSVPPTPPPGYEGYWPPASERPDTPPTPPPGHDGPWNPGGGGDISLRERIREIIRELNALLGQGKPGKAVGDADEGVRKLGVAPLAAEGGETLEA